MVVKIGGAADNSRVKPARSWPPGLRVLVFLLAGSSCSILLLAGAKVFAPSRAYHAKTYPAQETHDNEKLSIAADPFDLPEKAAIFNTDYKKAGFLPVRLIFSNDGDEPISLANMKMQLITAHGRNKLEPASSDDILRRIAKLPAARKQTPLPIPVPRKQPVPAIRTAKDELEQAQLLVKAVEPHMTRDGFVFFDVQGIDAPLAGARLYLSGLADNRGQELFYFEIALEKYLSYRTGVRSP